jgi:hypothetical protein
MNTIKSSLGWAALAACALLLASSMQTSGDQIPADRTMSGEGDQGHFAELWASSTPKQNDSYLVSFSEGAFEIIYVKPGVTATSPPGLLDLRNQMYSSGPFNWKLEFSFVELFQFKNNGDPSFGPEDTVISHQDLANEIYALLPPKHMNTANWGVMNTHTAISQDGLLSLEFVTTNDFVPYDIGGEIDPRDIHMSVRISGYDLSAGSDSIGLRMLVRSQSSTGIHFQNEGSESTLNITTSSPYAGGLVDLSNLAYIDGITRWAGQSWDGTNLTLSYPMANTTLQEFVFKVRSNITYYESAGIEPNPVLYAVGLGLATAAVATAIVLATRRRRSRNH